MGNYFKIDFYKLLVQLLPIRRRKPRFMALMSIISVQLQKIHFDFSQFKESTERKGVSQLCSLEALVNEWFDPYKRRIKLRNVKPNYDDFLIWDESSNTTQLISNEKPLLLQQENNFMLNHTNGEVVLPVGFSLTTEQKSLLEKILDDNKLPSKTYRIING